MRILRYLLTWYISLIQSQCCTILVFIKARFVFTTLFTRGSNKCSTAKIHGPYLGRDIFTGTGAGKLAIWIYKLSYQSEVEVEVEPEDSHTADDHSDDEPADGEGDQAEAGETEREDSPEAPDTEADHRLAS